MINLRSAQWYKLIHVHININKVKQIVGTYYIWICFYTTHQNILDVILTY